MKRCCQAVFVVQLPLGLFIPIQAKRQEKRQGNERRPNGLWVPEADQERSDLGTVDDQDHGEDNVVGNQCQHDTPLN